jgi:hypothetical protein
MPDIEKRLEAFVRLGHGIVVFPGGVGTAEEILYLLGILLHPDNADCRSRWCSPGRRESAPTSSRSTSFLRLTLGDAWPQRYRSSSTTRPRWRATMAAGIAKVRQHRLKQKDAFFFNWSLHIPHPFQQPFAPTHANMAGSTCTATSRLHTWRPTCAAPSPASSPATSRKRACARSRRTAPTRSRRPRDHAGAGRPAARVRRAAADEDQRGVQAVLPGGDT